MWHESLPKFEYCAVRLVCGCLTLELTCGRVTQYGETPDLSRERSRARNTGFVVVARDVSSFWVAVICLSHFEAPEKRKRAALVNELIVHDCCKIEVPLQDIQDIAKLGECAGNVPHS
jgi:hypothetical protein